MEVILQKRFVIRKERFSKTSNFCMNSARRVRLYEQTMYSQLICHFSSTMSDTVTVQSYVNVCLCCSVGMKLLPALPPLNAPTNNMERLSLFPSDLLWRYPAINFHSPSPTPLNNYLQMDFKTHLPATLGESQSQCVSSKLLTDILTFRIFVDYCKAFCTG